MAPHIHHLSRSLRVLKIGQALFLGISTTRRGIFSQIRGFVHLSLAKREKSESVEANKQPCSTAKAAK